MSSPPRPLCAGSPCSPICARTTSPTAAELAATGWVQNPNYRGHFLKLPPQPTKPIPHPFLQSCPRSPSTTSLTLQPPALTIMIPKKTPSINFLKKPNPTIAPEALLKLLDDPQSVLLLDLRSPESYDAGFIVRAINVAVPMRKLRKTAFTLEKMLTGFIRCGDQERVAGWEGARCIVAYDDGAGGAGVASAAFYVLEKFVQEGWKGESYVLEGGFRRFAEEYPECVEERGESGPFGRLEDESGDEGSGSSGGLASSNRCDILKAWKSSFPPANRDSWDEIDEISITLPDMAEATINQLPDWLLGVYKDGGSNLVAGKFKQLEQSQIQRLNGTYNADAPRYQLAGSDSAAKNRYRNIYPYEHSRVKLQKPEGCDYINASHLSVVNSSKRYISSQAPVPDAFNDFWNMVWEQDVNVIVMLTTTEEALRTVAHTYWKEGQYGPLKLRLLSDQMILLNEPSQDAWHEESKQKPVLQYICVRKFALVHEDLPLSAIRGITQIQDLAWPDFGVPDDPGHVCRIIDYMNQAIGPTSTPPKPVVVQCSAGCGRTGVFCTVDAVIDLLQREQSGSEDLVEEVVGRFRDQRMSMVQNLRQFVHCYEVVLGWFKAQGRGGGVEGGGGVNSDLGVCDGASNCKEGVHMGDPNPTIPNGVKEAKKVHF